MHFGKFVWAKTSVALFASEQKRAHRLCLTSVVIGTSLKRAERRPDLQLNVGTFLAFLCSSIFWSTFHASVYSYKQWRTEGLNCKFLVRKKWFANFMVHGSPQMKTTCTPSQNESELSQLLSESRLSSISYAFLLKIKYREMVFNRLCYVWLIVWSAVWWNLGRFPFTNKFGKSLLGITVWEERVPFATI